MAIFLFLCVGLITPALLICLNLLFILINFPVNPHSATLPCFFHLPQANSPSQAEPLSRFAEGFQLFGVILVHNHARIPHLLSAMVVAVSSLAVAVREVVWNSLTGQLIVWP